jgi:hypothetical protein
MRDAEAEFCQIPHSNRRNTHVPASAHSRRTRLRPSERYERRSVLISSNLVFSKWDQIFKDPMTTMAAIDRLVHHATILEFTNGSVRAPKTHERQADQPAAPAIPLGSTTSAAPGGATDSVPPRGIAPKPDR